MGNLRKKKRKTSRKVEEFIFYERQVGGKEGRASFWESEKPGMSGSLVLERNMLEEFTSNEGQVFFLRDLHLFPAHPYPLVHKHERYLFVSFLRLLQKSGKQ